MKEIDVICNRTGGPIYRVLDDGRIVDFSGRSRGWLRGRYIHDYQGAQRGSYEAGLFRMDDGAVAGYGENPTGAHPALPTRSVKPPAGSVEPEPPRPVPAVAATTTAPAPVWSTTPLEDML